ncbi:ribonuclease H-like domain-containing protein [Tanacetum coccineum]
MFLLLAGCDSHPNGTLAKITAIGSLRLTSGIVMFNILVFPEYSVSLLELWHCRLGHPADQVLSILGTKMGFSKHNQRSPCDIYPKAKQSREPFPLSDNKLPSSVLSGVSPYFLVYGKDPGLKVPMMKKGTLEDGNIRVTYDDYDNIVEDEVADVAT